MTPKLLLKESEAADALGLCPRTLRKARKEGRLHYVLIGSAVRYRTSDLSEFIEANIKTEATAKPPRPKTVAANHNGGNIVPFSQRAR